MRWSRGASLAVEAGPDAVGSGSFDVNLGVTFLPSFLRRVVVAAAVTAAFSVIISILDNAIIARIKLDFPAIVFPINETRQGYWLVFPAFPVLLGSHKSVKRLYMHSRLDS